MPPAVGTDHCLDERGVDAGSGRPWCCARRCQDLFATGALAEGDGNAYGCGAPIFADPAFDGLSGDLSCGILLVGGIAGQLADEGTNASYPELDVDPIGSDTSTRSTSSWMMRDCSAGNNSFQSGSNSSRASRTWDSVMPLMDWRALRQVWTMISGDSSRRRTWSSTIFSISAAGTRPIGQSAAPCFRTVWLT